jgi:hypothetical protein
MNLLALEGDFAISHGNAVFKGGIVEADAQNQASPSAPAATVFSQSGMLASDVLMREGTVHATLRFAASDGFVGADIVLLREQVPRISVTAGVANRRNAVFAVRQWIESGSQTAGTSGGQFEFRVAFGNLSVFRPDHDYHVEMRITGSRAYLVVDGVPVGAAELVPPLTRPLQVGIWCWSRTQVTVSGLSAAPKQPKAFVVMPFDGGFDAVYRDVIKPVCEEEFGISAVRGDEVFGPGMIISDLIEQMNDAQIIIADISTSAGRTGSGIYNPNVFFEIGYAFAREKPTILLARRGNEQLPFDVSSFRVLYYEDSIAGKAAVVDQLRKHLTAIAGKPTSTPNDGGSAA